MRILAGTSGFSYKAWKGNFYPADIADGDMLAHYAGRLPAVEVHNTFYRMPRSAVMKTWAEAVPEGFVFVIKASMRITHRSRLKESSAEAMGYLARAIRHLGAHQGPVLFQLPPNFAKDAPRLRDFVAALPEGMRAVFEFRHETWCDEEVHGILSDGGAAVCHADQEVGGDRALVSTTDFGYVRLRRAHYSKSELEAWLRRIRDAGWDEAFVFFKHEDDGVSPALAQELLSMAAAP